MKYNGTNKKGPFLARAHKLALLACLIGAVLVASFAPVMTKASHLDPSPLANADGALDNDTHVEAIYLSMRENWIAAMQMMTEQFVTVMMQQMLIFGTFLDAEQQLEWQRLIQKLKAEAHKDFHPSFQMCQFGTNVKSLATSNRTSVENAKILDQVLAEREHLNSALAAAGGIVMDVTHRIQMFKTIYCDINGENNQANDDMCDNSSGVITRRTKDVDYPRLIDQAYTLDVNYLDTDETLTEQDIISLGNHLYAGVTFDFIPEQLLNETIGMGLFMDTRSVHAIRSIARNSFTKIVGMKAEGDADVPAYTVVPYMHNIMLELGVPPAEIGVIYGSNPSYFAQMEILTRRIYQSPDFFVNLYDKPANVRRIGVSLQAIEIMQDRDRFESSLRREMLISMILELKLRKYQEDINTVLYSGAGAKFNTPEL